MRTQFTVVVVLACLLGCSSGRARNDGQRGPLRSPTYHEEPSPTPTVRRGEPRLEDASKAKTFSIATAGEVTSRTTMKFDEFEKKTMWIAPPFVVARPEKHVLLVL
jgi:hypothetical protein